MTQRITTDIDKVANLLIGGGIAAIPTETVYGLAANALNQQAVSRVFTVKGRPTDHPLIVHLHPEMEYERWGYFNESAIALLHAFCPGPLTILVPKTDMVPLWVTGGRQSVALRFPLHPMTQQLLKITQLGLVAPSANKFGHVSPTTAQHVLDDLADHVDLILDGGPCTIGVESTIVECIDNSVQVLRPGAITAQQISDVLGVPLSLTEGESRAPGMLLAHYAPHAKVVLVETAQDAENTLARLNDEGYSTQLLYFPDVEQYAMNLYDSLRRADVFGADVIIALLPEPEGLGLAIRDRLSKAAAGR